MFKLYYCFNCMDNRSGVRAMCSLPVPQRSAHAAFIHCVILSLYQLLKLNDDEDDDVFIGVLKGVKSCTRLELLNEIYMCLGSPSGV